MGGKRNLNGDAPSQRQRIVSYLKNRTGGAATLDRMKDLDVLHSGTRICGLRQEGHTIMTHSDIQDTALGRHRVARYVLMQ